MGKPLEGLQKVKEAKEETDKVDLTEAEKENLLADLNDWLTYAYCSNDMSDEAKSTLELYKQDVDRRNNPVEKDYLERDLALIDYKEGKYDAAIDRFSKLKQDPWIMFYQAQAYLEKGDKEAAKKLFNKIINWNQNTLGLAVLWNRTHQEIEK